MPQTLLIIDDDLKLTDLLSEYLAKNDYTVHAVHDGMAALSAVREKGPDLVILDIMLPGKDGLQVLKEIRADFSLPVIMLTARGDDTDRIVAWSWARMTTCPNPSIPGSFWPGSGPS